MVSVAPELSPLRKANKAEAAEFFGVSLPTIEAWIRRGAPVIQRGRRGLPWVLDLLAVAKWRYGASDSDDETTDPENMHPKDRKDWYDGEKRRGEIQLRDGELIQAADFNREYSRMIKVVAAGLETLPDLLERDAGLSGKELEPVFRSIDGLREELYQALITREKDDES